MRVYIAGMDGYLGWALAQCPLLCAAFLNGLFPATDNWQVNQVRLQEGEGGPGFTDIELLGPDVHVIVEAKRGWIVPNKEQLGKYAARLEHSNREHSVLVSMSECSREFAALYLPKQVRGQRVEHVPWSAVQSLCAVKAQSHAEGRQLPGGGESGSASHQLGPLDWAVAHARVQPGIPQQLSEVEPLLGFRKRPDRGHGEPHHGPGILGRRPAFPDKLRSRRDTGQPGHLSAVVEGQVAASEERLAACGEGALV